MLIDSDQVSQYYSQPHSNLSTHLHLRHTAPISHHDIHHAAAAITATKAGLKVTTSEIETHYLAGGHVPSVIRALISADKANISLSFKQATAIDLAGRDVFEAVQISVNPKVINTPSVAAVAAGEEEFSTVVILPLARLC